MTTVQQRPNWPAIAQAAIAGIPYADLSKRFGVTHAAIKKQSQRNRWPVPNRILKRARELSPVVPGDAVDTAAENWLAHGQAANGFALRILRAKLERAASKLDSIADLADLADVEGVATAAKMARLCAGLDSAVMVTRVQSPDGITSGGRKFSVRRRLDYRGCGKAGHHNVPVEAVRTQQRAFLWARRGAGAVRQNFKTAIRLPSEIFFYGASTPRF
jgi:hypothetical protein